MGRWVKGPNGTEMELDEVVASGLVGGSDKGWEYIDGPDEADEKPKRTRKAAQPKAPAAKKAAAPKPSPDPEPPAGPDEPGADSTEK